MIGIVLQNYYTSRGQKDKRTVRGRALISVAEEILHHIVPTSRSLEDIYKMATHEVILRSR